MTDKLDQLKDLWSLAWQQGLKILLLLILGFFLLRAVKKLSNVIVKGLGTIDSTLAVFVAKSLQYLTAGMIALMILAQLGFQTTSILTLLGTAGVAIGLALQGTLANIAAGLMLLFLRPFKVGDSISAGSDLQGTILVIGLFTTEIVSDDGQYLVCPNTKLWSSTIVNYSRLPTRRLLCYIDIEKTSNYEKALKALSAILPQVRHVAKTPVPKVAIKEITEFSIRLQLAVWTQKEHYGDLGSEVYIQSLLRLKEEGIPLASRQQLRECVEGPMK